MRRLHAGVIGFVFCEYDQTNRVYFYDVCGVKQHIDLPTKHFKYKVGADGTWIISQ